MDENRPIDDLEVIEGADDAALGTAEPPSSAPAGAVVDATERLVPGADADATLGAEGAKPWSSTLAARSVQAGVRNEDADETGPDPAWDDDDHLPNDDRD
jgi:hypothetical protein